MNNAINTAAAANANALTVRAIDNEPRILDTDLAERLGMARPTNIRGVIEQNRDELEGFGGLHTENANPGQQGGRPSVAYQLNEEQALLICLLSRTEKAREVRTQVIQVFTAWRRGELIHPARPSLPDFSNPIAAARAWADAEEAKLIAQQKVIELAPKAAFVDTYVAANGALSSRDAGKVFGMSAQRFNAELRTRRIFFRNENTPIQRYVDEGWFIVAPWGRNGQTGTQTRVTPMGMTKLAELINQEDDEAA